MVWGYLAATKVLRAAVRSSEDRRRATGAVLADAGPRPVSFVVPAWLGVFSGGFLSSWLLVVVAFSLRLVSSRSTPTEALAAALVGTIVLGVPGLALVLASSRGHRLRSLLRRVQALALGKEAVALSDIATALEIDCTRAKELALVALREGHVIGRFDEERQRLVVG